MPEQPDQVEVTDRWALHIDGDRLDAIFSDPDGPIGKIMLGLAAKAENAAKRKCPVDTGRLRASISHRVEVDQSENVVVGVIGTNVEYAVYQEFGTERVPPRAFLRGGVDEAIRGMRGVGRA